MKRVILFTIVVFFCTKSFSQCPDLLQAMVNSCGTSEGNNEFVVFKTQSTDTAGAYTLNYGSTNPPSVNNLSGHDATAKTGTGSVTTTGTCSVIEVTSSTTEIPTGMKVIFVPASLDQNYDVTGLCDGSNPIYVVYIKTNSAGGTSSNWSVGGTLSNSASSPRYLQITYAGSSFCSNANATVKAYSASGNWSSNTDGNFVSWSDTAASYANNGCTSIITPLSLISLKATRMENYVSINWTTVQESSLQGYEIQRSTDATHFKNVQFVSSKNLSGINDYQYLDKENLTGVIYYRLKITEYSGNISYSKVVSVNSKNNQSAFLNIYPNPTTDVINVAYYSVKPTSIKVLISDVQGRLVVEKNQPLIIGHNEFTIPVNSLATGRYSVKLITDANNEIKTFYKK